MLGIGNFLKQLNMCFEHDLLGGGVLVHYSNFEYGQGNFLI